MNPEKSIHTMRTAFQNEVRPNVYFGRVMGTAAVIALGMIGLHCFHQGKLHPEFIAPLNGWYSRDPAGVLYIETWATIFVNALMIGFGFWGGWLVLVGIVKVPLVKRFVPTCFTLGGAFLVMAYILPQLVQVLTQMLASAYPNLAR